MQYVCHTIAAHPDAMQQCKMPVTFAISWAPVETSLRTCCKNMSEMQLWCVLITSFCAGIVAYLTADKVGFISRQIS